MTVSARKPLVLALGVLLGLGLLLGSLLNHLELDQRLDAFLPAPQDHRATLIADQLVDNAAGRMVLAAVEVPDPAGLADLSRDLLQAWQQIPGVVAVYNGDNADRLDDFAWLLPQHLLLAPNPADYLSQEAIRQALEQRLADLALAGTAALNWTRRDPLGIVQELIASHATVESPERFDGVWVDADTPRALLIVITDVPAFNPVAQRALVADLYAVAATLSASPAVTLTGPAVFSVEIDRAARRDAARLTGLAVGWLLLLLLVVWRCPTLIVASAVPLLTGVCTGLLAVVVGFPAVHGLTLAFGFTLLGVVLDYPVHLFAHRHAARTIRMPLSLSVLSSLIAFTAIWWSGSRGLAQIGAFSAVGLLVAAAVTLLVLPRLRLPSAPPPPRVVRSLLRGPRPGWLPALVLLGSMAGLLWMHDRLWSDDLRDLSPVDPTRLETDRELRQALRAPESRYLLLLVDRDLDALLEATESLTADLHEARQRGLLADWQAVTMLVPSRATQARRRQAWADTAQLTDTIRANGVALGFRADAFEPFFDDLDGLADQPAITLQTWQDTAMWPQVEGLLQHTPSGWRSLVLPSGVTDPIAFADWLAGSGLPVELVDLVEVAQTLVADYRRQVLIALGIALGLIVLLVGVRLGRVAELLRVMLPPLAATAATAVVVATGGGLTVVHLTALILVAAIGLDYALFLRRLSGNPDESAATLWSLMICAASTGGVFFILGRSHIPLLAQLGSTVALGIAICWLLVWVSCRTKPPAGC